MPAWLGEPPSLEEEERLEQKVGKEGGEREGEGGEGEREMNEIVMKVERGVSGCLHSERRMFSGGE